MKIKITYTQALDLDLDVALVLETAGPDADLVAIRAAILELISETATEKPWPTYTVNPMDLGALMRAVEAAQKKD